MNYLIIMVKGQTHKFSIMLEKVIEIKPWYPYHLSKWMTSTDLQNQCCTYDVIIEKKLYISY